MWAAPPSSRDARRGRVQLTGGLDVLRRFGELAYSIDSDSEGYLMRERCHIGSLEPATECLTEAPAVVAARSDDKGPKPITWQSPAGPRSPAARPALAAGSPRATAAAVCGSAERAGASVETSDDELQTRPARAAAATQAGFGGSVVELDGDSPGTRPRGSGAQRRSALRGVGSQAWRCRSAVHRVGVVHCTLEPCAQVGWSARMTPCMCERMTLREALLTRGVLQTVQCP